VSRREMNTRLRDPITVRSTLSGLSNYYYCSLDFFWIIFYPFPYYKALPSYLITSPVPTCLVHNCETSQRLFYSHLLSPLSRDQIPFDPHQCDLSDVIPQQPVALLRVMIRSEPSSLMANYSKIKRAKLPWSCLTTAVEGNWNKEE